MEVYRVREVKIIDTGDEGIKLKPLREYERQSSDQAGIIEQVRHFFEMEMSSPKAPETVDFDAIEIVMRMGKRSLVLAFPTFGSGNGMMLSSAQMPTGPKGKQRPADVIGNAA